MSSKLGYHWLGGNPESKQLLDAGCVIAKSVDDAGIIAEALAINPRITAIMRFNSPVITGDQMRHMAPHDAAVWYVNQFAEKYRLNPFLKDAFVEGVNEYVPSTVDDVAWYAAFEVERIAALKTLGLRACIANWSTGVPHIAPDDLTWWNAFLPALRAARDSGGILGMHAYSSGNLTQDPSNILRYRMIHDLILVPNGLGDLKIALTEFGRLDWMLHTSQEQYANELLAIDSELMRDDYLLGVTVYCFGSTPGWENYRINQYITTRMVEHIRAVANTTPPPQPETPPKLFSVGQTVQVTDRNGTKALNVRRDPVNGVIGTPISAVPSGMRGTVLSDPFYAMLNGNRIAWLKAVFENGVQGNVSQNYLDPVTVTPPPQRVNLLVNPSFDNGYYHWHNVPELAIPNEWGFWYQGDVSIRLDRQDDPFFPPECVNWNKKDAPDHEKGVLFLDGDYNEKVFKGWGPIWWRLSQAVRGLTIGKRYRFTAPVFPDLVMRYDDGQKVWADDPLAGEIRLTAGESDSGWRDGNSFPFGQYTRHQLDFVATAESALVTLECRGRWGLIENGFFVDDLHLEEL